MGRLIDTSAFDEITIKDKSEDFVDGAKYILDLIDAQPTAYDVKKVIDKLNEESFSHDELDGDAYYLETDVAISIVKMGGVE